MRIKNLFLGILLATGASNPVFSQDAAKEMYVSIPCRVDADDVTFSYDADEQVLPEWARGGASGHPAKNGIAPFIQ
ncbi:MAG: hypothetical protein IPN85_17035 [Flavobacteriales bacterium]|nr:hypothetical protein [Flavobacteriales bacterium]